MANDVIDRPGLRRLWDAVADRLQRNGLQPAGSVVIAGLDRDERHAIAGVLGKPVPGDRVSVDLRVLDRRLRASGVASGLVDAVEARRAAHWSIVPVARQAKLNARHAVWHAGRAALDGAGLSAAPWAEAWLDDVRRAGALGRLPPDRATTKLVAAVACIRQLPVRADDPPCARGDLASRVAGDAHASTMARCWRRSCCALLRR